MLKWLKRFAKKERPSLRKPSKGNKNRFLDVIKAELDKIKASQIEVLGVSEKLKHQSLCVENHSATIKDLQKQVSTINETVVRLSATLEISQETFPTTSATNPTTTEAEEFTERQDATLIILCKLAGKDGGQWISMKTLVHSLYPGHDYNKVRTTIFEYIRLFEDLGLIRRAKRGTRTYIALTQRGVETAKKKLSAKKAKLLYLPEIET